MGVYYTTSIAWGLRIPQTEELIGTDLTDVYELPAGFDYIEGGDLMNGEDIAYVIHPVGGVADIMSTMSSTESFGVFSLDEIYNPTTEATDALVVLARQHGLDEDIGWFAVSSVG